MKNYYFIIFLAFSYSLLLLSSEMPAAKKLKTDQQEEDCYWEAEELQRYFLSSSKFYNNETIKNYIENYSNNGCNLAHNEYEIVSGIMGEIFKYDVKPDLVNLLKKIFKLKNRSISIEESLAIFNKFCSAREVYGLSKVFDKEILRTLLPLDIPASTKLILASIVNEFDYLRSIDYQAIKTEHALVAMHFAIKNNNIEIIQYLTSIETFEFKNINDVLDPNMHRRWHSKFYDKMHPFYLAVKKGNQQAIDLIFDSCFDENNEQLLQVALRYGDRNLAKRLILCGARVEPLSIMHDDIGDVYETSLALAASNNDLEILKLVFGQIEDLDNYQFLIESLTANDNAKLSVETLELLTKLRIPLIHDTTYDSQLVFFFYATENCSDAVVDWFMQKCEITIDKVIFAYHEEPSKQFSLVRTLLNKYDATFKGVIAAIKEAVYDDLPDEVRFWINYGMQKKLINEDNVDKLVKFLLTKAKNYFFKKLFADISPEVLRNFLLNSEVFLHDSIKAFRQERTVNTIFVLQTLCYLSCFFDMKNTEGHHFVDIIDRAISAASVKNFFINKRNSNGLTALSYAAISGNTDLVNNLLFRINKNSDIVSAIMACKDLHPEIALRMSIFLTTKRVF